MMKGFNTLMKQAQEMQNKLEKVKEDLEQEIVEGSSGGGLIKVKATAKGTVKNISIDPSLIKPEDQEILEDLLVAAFNDAKIKGEEKSKEKMDAITGGLNLPAGMKLPF